MDSAGAKPASEKRVPLRPSMSFTRTPSPPEPPQRAAPLTFPETGLEEV
jgi:hypothetical protein